MGGVESTKSTNKEAIINATMNLMGSSILAQDELFALHFIKFYFIINKNQNMHHTKQMETENVITDLPRASKFPKENVIPNLIGLKKTSIDCLKENNYICMRSYVNRAIIL